ncbi:MAG: asparagine synthase C-terminal domain-containing protein [Candidatus Woesearchaeota archaeon]|nr:asparagine synthase C-terminal domain-containing protein [Candidatus Woesearchaeota archaeon]
MAELSGISKDGRLVSKEQWEGYIESLKEKISSKDIISDEKKAVTLIEQPFIEAIKRRLPKKRFGIFFSGGVDSTGISFICRQLKADFVCYTVGIEGSEDLMMSARIAGEYGFNHVKKELSLKEMDLLFRRLAKILDDKDKDVVNYGVGAVELAALDLAEKDGISVLFGGLGSEEIFAGYHRHEQSQDINEECWKGLKTTYSRDFGRDYSIAKHKQAAFLTPFLDKDLILAAMQVSGDLKIRDGHKKYIFRVLMQKLGLKEEYAFRPKKAAQYGSSFDKALSRLAKMNGGKFKKDYLSMLR